MVDLSQGNPYFRSKKGKAADAPRVHLEPSIQVKRLSENTFRIRLNYKPLCHVDSSTNMFRSFDCSKSITITPDTKKRIMDIISVFKSL